MDVSTGVTIITGAASGMGAATARLLTERGTKVLMADVQDERGNTGSVDDGTALEWLHDAGRVLDA